MNAFDPSGLQPADQQAFLQWQNAVKAHGTPTALEGYLMQHPEGAAAAAQAGYSPAEIQQAQSNADYLAGRHLPPSVQQMLKGYHANTDTATFDKNKGLFNNWETWAQIAAGAGLGGAAAAGLGAAATPSANAGGLVGSGEAAVSSSPGLAAGPSVAGSATGAGTATGGGLASQAWLKPAIAAGAGLAGKAATGGFGEQNNLNIPASYQSILDLLMHRIQSQQPLFEATQRQYLAGLPTYAQPKGGT